MFPWQVLADGNGKNEKGFKAEWMTVKGNINSYYYLSNDLKTKDEMLFVGGMGKEYVLPDGSIPHRNPEYVKQISPLGNDYNYKINIISSL